MKKLTNFQCEFCEKIYKTESNCISHELSCKLNPIKKTCSSCILKGARVIHLGNNTRFTFNVCLLNHDIMSKDKIMCDDFVGNDYLHKDLIIQQAKNVVFNHEKATNRAKLSYLRLSNSIS